MSEKNYVLNVKTKAGTIFTVRGDTYEEFLNKTNAAIDAAVEVPIAMLEASLVGAAPIALAAQTINASNATVTTTSGSFTPVPPPTVTPQSQFGGAGTSSKSCIHGEMTKREGSGQWGPYKAYYCPTPKGTPDQCKAVYVKPNEPEWNTF